MTLLAVCHTLIVLLHYQDGDSRHVWDINAIYIYLPFVPCWSDLRYKCSTLVRCPIVDYLSV